MIFLSHSSTKWLKCSKRNQEQFRKSVAILENLRYKYDNSLCGVLESKDSTNSNIPLSVFLNAYEEVLER